MGNNSAAVLGELKQLPSITDTQADEFMTDENRN
jgi:hypothetical protein